MNIMSEMEENVPPLHSSLCSTSVQHRSEQTNASSTKETQQIQQSKQYNDSIRQGIQK